MFKIALAQYPITIHGEFSAWAKHTENWIKAATDNHAKLLVFPEYGSMELCSLFSKAVQQNLNAQISEIVELKDDFTKTFSDLAKKYKVYVVAPSLPVLENSKAINRAFFFNPQGEIEFQDKLNMTRFEDEEWSIKAAPPELKVFETELGSIGINICFDSEFPQLAFEQSQAGMKLLLAPSCTASRSGLQRVHVGCQARALENQIIVAQCSTVGTADWSPAVDINIGQAKVFGPPDEGFPSDGIIASGELNVSQWVFADLNLKLVDQVREKGNVFNFKKSADFMKRNSELTIRRIKF